MVSLYIVSLNINVQIKVSLIQYLIIIIRCTYNNFDFAKAQILFELTALVFTALPLSLVWKNSSSCSASDKKESNIEKLEEGKGHLWQRSANPRKKKREGKQVI